MIPSTSSISAVVASRSQRRPDLLDVVVDVAIVIDRIDDGLPDGRGPGIQILELELPEQVIGQRLLRSISLLESQVGVGAARRITGTRPLDIVPLRIRAGLGIAGHLALGRLRRLGRVPALGLLGFEHDVLLERIENLRLQLHDGQLQQPYGLLQLRRHRQLLAEPEL